MDEQRRKARDYLNDASLSNYWDVVREAKILDTDKPILDARFIKGMCITQIAMEYNCSEEKVKAIIKRAYDKISKLI